MSDLCMTPLSELCDNFKSDIVDGPFGANLKREHYKTVGVPVLKIQNIKSFKITLKKMDYVDEDKYQELKRHSYRKGDIVMTKLGNPLGESAIVENIDDGLIVADLVRIRAQKVDTKYLCYHLNSPVTSSYINAQQKGTTRPRVRISVVRDLPIYTPSISEQKRIVAILDQAFADIEQACAKTEQNLKNARDLFESYLQKVFSQRGDGWSEASILDLTTKLGDGLHGTPKYDAEGEFFFINGNNLDDGKITIKENTKRVTEEEYNKHKKPLNERTIFVSINGTLGNVAFYNNEKVILGKSACYFNLQESVNKEYVKFVIESPLFQKYALQEATGTTIKNVSLKTMRAFKVPLAPPIQQAEIVRVLKTLKQQYFHLERIYSKKLTNLDELKKSILQKAFSGELSKEKEGVAA